MTRNNLMVLIYLLLVGCAIISLFAYSHIHASLSESKYYDENDNKGSISVEPILQHLMDDDRPYDDDKVDIFGIKKIYDTKPGGFEWYMNMDDPREDRHIYNDGKIDASDDNSYSTGDRSRISVYSEDGIGNDEGNMGTYDFSELHEKGYWHKPTDWKNVEITGEYLHTGGDGPGITHFVRSEDHSELHDGCGGSSYKNKIYFDGTSNFNKEQTHPTSWEMPKIEHNYGDLKNHWFRFKTVVYNLPNENVNLENWLDPYNNNSWTRIGQLTDNGEWGEDGTKCGGAPDQIITWGSPSVTFRWDDVSIDFRNLSVREIDPY